MLKIIKTPGSVFVAVLMMFLALPAQADESDFPVPANILPAIEFWKKVYTEADTGSGFLHDARNLSVIYEKLARDNNLINAHRKQISDDLRVLASGKRNGLTQSQQKVLALWGPDVSNAELEEAASNVRWQLGQSNRFRDGLVRSGAYRAHIEAVALAKGMPVELAALPHVESSFHPGAFSSVAASGMWQFMRETAQRFMQVDVVVDERLDPYRATYAAMDLLQGDYRMLGSWPLALTAYNHGANGIARAVSATGSSDIGEIIAHYKGPRFGFASRNFYPQFLAVLEVERNADHYFGPLTLDRAPDFAEIRMPAFMEAAVVADTLGVSVDALKRVNPALQSLVWNGSKRIPKEYTLKVDRADFGGNVVASLNAIPAANFFTAQIPDLSYTVRSGDSLSGIASRYKTSVSELATINQLRNRNAIRAGQVLILPQQNGTVPTLVVGNQTAQPVPADGEYVVRRGDTIIAIANRFNMAADTLLALNKLTSRSVIYPGQELVLAANDLQPLAETTVGEQLQASLDEISRQSDVAAVVEDVQVADTATGGATAQTVQNSATMARLDYTVASDNTIEIMADETLGHFADWLQMSSADLRRLNQLRANAAVRVGDRFKLDFSKVDKPGFEARRQQYHSSLQAQYFASYRILETENYSIKRSELLGNLARARSIPMWLFRQYNPDVVDTSQISIGQVVVFPVVERVNN